MGQLRIQLVASGVAALALGGCYTGLSSGAGGGDDPGDTTAGGGVDGSGSDDSTGGDPGMLSCEEIGAQPLRRISSAQYQQILRDILPPAFADAALAAAFFPATNIDAGFSTYATANTVSTNESIQIEDNAEAIAAIFDANRAEYAPLLVPCLPAGYTAAEIDGCIDGFVNEFGARAFRRELTAGELDAILALYQGVRDSDGADAGLTAVVHYFSSMAAIASASSECCATCCGRPLPTMLSAPSPMGACGWFSRRRHARVRPTSISNPTASSRSTRSAR